MTKPRKIKDGYIVIPVKLRESSSAQHELFVKRHQAREVDPQKPGDKTLFVLNVPQFVSEVGLEHVFSACGPVTKVFLYNRPTSKPDPPHHADSFSTKIKTQGYQVAYIVFKSAAGLRAAVDPDFEHTRPFYEDEVRMCTGMEKWCKQYGTDYIKPEELQAEINSYMEEYDRKEQQEETKEKAAEGVPDEDGWITVTRHGRNKGVARTEVNEQRTLAKEKRKRQNKELLNFYAFQQRESKRDHIAKLRVKFEEDKSKVEQMKAARKFKPY